MKVTAALSGLPPLMELIGGVGMALALVYGAVQVSTNLMTSGAFFSFMAALLLMYGPAKKLSRVNANLQQTMAASERIFEMLDTLASLRAQIGIVTQETVLFDDTIASNIAYGSREPSREAIEAAARAANAHDFVAALPGGYDTTIGERGQRLSGGQRQRLAIA